MYLDHLSKRVDQSILSLKNLKNLKNFNLICKVCIQAIKNKKKIIFCGNGGSASDAQHLAAELVVKLKKKRKALAALSLATDTSILTAVGNDFGFRFIFSRQVEAIGNPGDVLIAISTSGNSENLLLAVKKANQKKMISLSICGNNGGKLRKLSKYSINLKDRNATICQTIQILLGQSLCEIIEGNV